MIVPVNDKHHQATQNDYHLQRRIGVKGQSAKQQRDGQKVAVLHAVTQVKVEKNAKERGAKRGFKGSATVQKPGGYHADNEGRKPPILYLEEIAQCQAKRERKNDGEQRGNAPREPDGAFKWCHQACSQTERLRLYCPPPFSK